MLLCTRLQKKKLWQSSVWEITRFTMNTLRNSQTVSDEENNDRKFSSLVREVGGGGVGSYQCLGLNEMLHPGVQTLITLSISYSTGNQLFLEVKNPHA